MLLGDTVQPPGEHVELARHRYLHDQAFALINQVGISLRPSGELPVKALENALPGAVDEQSVEKIQEAIAGGSLDCPARPQIFVLQQNFFRGHVEAAASPVAGGNCWAFFRKRGLCLKVLEILKRVEQSVRMVDTNARNQTLADQAKWDAVNAGEHFRVFHPDGSQVIDIEKAAVVDFIGRNPPETQAISLIV